MTNTCPRILVSVLTAAMIAVLCVSAFSSPVASMELRMSQSSENALADFLSKIAEAPRRPTLMERIVAEQMRRGLTTNNVLNINAMDVLDPVHHRTHRERATEQDYDGDMGREYSDHLRDNGISARSASVGTFVQIADALPKIEAPSIVAEFPDQTEQTVAYLTEREKNDG